MSSTTESVAGEVRAALARSKVRQGTVAQALGVSRATASRKVNGQIAFSVPELVIVAGLAKVDVAEFFSDAVPASRVASSSAYTDVA